MVAVNSGATGLEFITKPKLLTSSRIGQYIPSVPTSGLTAREAIWNRVACLENVTITYIKFPIYALTGSIRLIVVETNTAEGNATKGTAIYTGTYAAPASPPCVHEFNGLNISLEKDKLYAIIFESETGTTLAGATGSRAVLGQGSLLPSSNDLGGYTTRASSTLTQYSSSTVCCQIDYQ